MTDDAQQPQPLPDFVQGKDPDCEGCSGKDAAKKANHNFKVAQQLRAELESAKSEISKLIDDRSRFDDAICIANQEKADAVKQIAIERKRPPEGVIRCMVAPWVGLPPNLKFGVIVLIVILSMVTMFHMGGSVQEAAQPPAPRVVEKPILITPPAYTEMLDFVTHLQQHDPDSMKLIGNLLPASRLKYETAISKINESKIIQNETPTTD